MTGLIYLWNYKFEIGHNSNFKKIFRGHQHHWNTFIQCFPDTFCWPVIVKALLQRYRVHEHEQEKKNHSQPHISSCQRSTCQCCSRGGGSRAQRRQPHGTCSWPHQSLHESASCFLQQEWPRKEQCLEGGTSLGDIYLIVDTFHPLSLRLESECNEWQQQKGLNQCNEEHTV